MRKGRKTYKRTYIRAWREYRGLSLERLAERLTDADTQEAMLTPTSLSRIERGLQPYSQAVLEAIAEALACTPADLIMRNPQDTEAPWSIWETLEPMQRQQAVEILRTLSSGTRAA